MKWKVDRHWDRVPDWDDAEGYPETTDAFRDAISQRIRETKIAWEEVKEFDRVYKWCLMKSGSNKMQDCRDFRKVRMNRIHWPMDGLPPAVRIPRPLPSALHGVVR